MMKNWQIKTLKEVYIPLSNLSYARECLTENPQRLRYIHYGDIHTDKIVAVISATNSVPFLSDSICVSNEAKYLLRPMDLVLVDASEDYEGVGKVIEIADIRNQKIVAGLHTIPLRPTKTAGLISGFGRYLLKHPLVSKRLKAISQGTKVFSISFSLINKVKVFLPPKEEQEKIVKVLETWDKAIELTKQLIEQKELQKKYLMQQLLTGQTRFRGFTERWKNIQLGNICIIKTGKLDANAMNPEGKYRFFTCSKEIFFIDTFAFDTEALLISGNGNVGHVNYYKGKFNAYQRTYVLDRFSENIIFTKYALEFFLPRRLSQETKAGNMPYIVLSTLSKMSLRYPDKEEQHAIAALLSFRDKEIDLLKQKLAKLEEQKKGLMQVLLTGKVRL